MPKWVRLLDALENPNKYGRLTKIPVDYHPDNQSIIISEKESGTSEKQEVETEQEITYYPIKFKENLYLVAEGLTTGTIALCGSEGYKNGPEILKNYSQIYGNDSLGAEGVRWDLSTIGILEFLPKFLCEISEPYWTAIQYQHTYDNGRGRIYGIRLVFSNTFQGDRMNNGVLHRSNKSNFYTIAAIRPLILLPPDILVDVQNFDGGPLKIKRGPKEEKNAETSKLSEVKAKESESVKAMLEELRKKATLISRISETTFIWNEKASLQLETMHSLSREILSIIDEIEKQNSHKV